MYRRGETKRGRTKRRREKEDISGLGCTIVDDLLSKERVKLFCQNLEGDQLVMGRGSFFIYTIGALELPSLALPDLPSNILEDLRLERTMRKAFLRSIVSYLSSPICYIYILHIYHYIANFMISRNRNYG